jgi:hypothetical protein
MVTATVTVCVIEPLVPAMVTVYVPKAEFLAAETVRTTEEVPPEVSVILFALSIVEGA